MFAIGLTGGICTGKSYVLGIFDELGCFTLRADELAKQVIFSPDSPAAREIAAMLGPKVLNDENGLDKEAFAHLLFEDAEKRQLVNEIVHPLVARERNQKMADIEKTGIYDFFIYESALLVEAGTYRDFEKIIIVYTSSAEQVRRLMARDGISRRAAEKKIHSQFPLKEKLKVADYAIDTSGSLDNTRLATLEVFHLMKRDFGIPNTPSP